MKLLTVGDSFTYGEELKDLKFAWPFLLGDRLGYEVINLAKPGVGNTCMVRHCVEQIDNFDLVIIAWSQFARIEIADENGLYDMWPGNKGNRFKDKLSYRKELLEYINRHHNDAYLYTEYLLKIILLQSFLEENNKKYIMLDSFGNTKKIERNYNTKLINKVKSTNYLGWPNETMMEWTWQTPQGPGGHFLEAGHKIVANKIYEHIRHLGWIS